MTSIGLRPATARDSEFCFRLHKAALGDAVAAIWGWDEDVQHDFHNRVFAPGRWQIITADGTDAGMLHVEYGPTETWLARIELHPDHQGRGIGSGLVRLLLREAEQRDQALVLDVLAVNERAQALYRRLGQREVARHGDGGVKVRMSSRPAAASDPPGPDGDG